MSEIADEIVRSGAPPTTTQLAVAVIALGAPEETVEAIESLLSQSVQPEIVVVNSGGGDAATLLARAGIKVTLIDRPERLYAGAARNLGIAATRAPYVAFLASDCLAGPNWVRERLLAHHAGHAAVGSALINRNPLNIFAWTAYISLHSRRAPRTSRTKALVYGVSYDRRLFEKYGLFREDLRTGEDSEFNRRLVGTDAALWQPTVVTVNRYPTGPFQLMADHYRRGARAASAEFEIFGKCRPYDIRMWRSRIAHATLQSRRRWRRRDRPFIIAAWALLPFAVAAYCLGASRWIRSNGVHASWDNT